MRQRDVPPLDTHGRAERTLKLDFADIIGVSLPEFRRYARAQSLEAGKAGADATHHQGRSSKR